jgi:hypothetical protein
MFQGELSARVISRIESMAGFLIDKDSSERANRYFMHAVVDAEDFQIVIFLDHELEEIGMSLF